MCTPEPSDPPAPETAVRSNIVLVVEDEILIRLAIADHLRDAGLTVYEAANATEAIDLLTHHGRDIDAIFSDIMMPGPIDGLALLAWVSQHHPEIPVALTSGVPHHNATTKKMKDDGLFLVKPYSMDGVATLLTAKAKARAQRRDDPTP
jgi:DNA-binding NtrC family response regulator